MELIRNNHHNGEGNIRIIRDPKVTFRFSPESCEKIQLEELMIRIMRCWMI